VPIDAHFKVSTLRRLSGVKRKYGFVMPTAGDGAANWQLEYTTAPRHRPVLDLTLDCTPALSSSNEGPIPDPSAADHEWSLNAPWRRLIETGSFRFRWDSCCAARYLEGSDLQNVLS
jgi:hypothetical protein